MWIVFTISEDSSNDSILGNLIVMLAKPKQHRSEGHGAEQCTEDVPVMLYGRRLDATIPEIAVALYFLMPSLRPYPVKLFQHLIILFLDTLS